MNGTPYARMEVSKIGLLLGLALLAFGLYTTVTFFRAGGRGYALTALRGVVALPLAGVALYLSFGSACSVCGASLVRRELRTTPARAAAAMQAAALGDGPGTARALEAARADAGDAWIAAEVCPRCRRLARLRASGGTGERRVLAGDAALPVAGALLPAAETN